MRCHAFANVFLTLMAIVASAVAQTDPTAQEQKPISVERKALLELGKHGSLFALSKDLDDFLSVWTEDMVALPPGQAPVIGKAGFRRMLEKWHEQLRGYSLGSHNESWQGEGPKGGDYIFAWGTITVELNPLRGTEAQPIRKKYHAMRMLKRQPDGSWKFHRIIWNEAPADL